MNITIHRDGQNYGPYTLDQVKEYLGNGTLNETDLAWHEGTTQWLLLKDVIISLTLPPPPPKLSSLPLPSVNPLVSQQEVKVASPKRTFSSGKVVGLIAGVVVIMIVIIGLSHRRHSVAAVATQELEVGQRIRLNADSIIGTYSGTDQWQNTVIVTFNKDSTYSFITKSQANEQPLIGHWSIDTTTRANDYLRLVSSMGFEMYGLAPDANHPGTFVDSLLHVSITKLNNAVSPAREAKPTEVLSASSTIASQSTTGDTGTTATTSSGPPNIEGHWVANEYSPNNDTGVNEWQYSFYAWVHDGKFELVEWYPRDSDDLSGVDSSGHSNLTSLFRPGIDIETKFPTKGTVYKRFDFLGELGDSSTSLAKDGKLTYKIVVHDTRETTLGATIDFTYTPPDNSGNGEALHIEGEDLHSTTESMPPVTDREQMNKPLEASAADNNSQSNDSSIAGVYEGTNKNGGTAQLRIGAMPQSDVTSESSANSFDLMIDERNPMDYIAGTWTRSGENIELHLSDGSTSVGIMKDEKRSIHPTIQFSGITFKKQ